MCSRAPTDDAMLAGDIDGANVYLSSPALHRVVRFRGVWPDGSERGRPNGLKGEKGRRVAASESRPVTYCKEENGVVSADDGRETDLRIPPRSHRHCRGVLGEDEDDGDELLQRIN